MLDVSTAMLANQASNFLATGKVPERLGNQHPNIVPYQARSGDTAMLPFVRRGGGGWSEVMPAADGYFILSVGNDPTFERFIAVAEKAQHISKTTMRRSGVASGPEMEPGRTGSCHQALRRRPLQLADGQGGQSDAQLRETRFSR